MINRKKLGLGAAAAALVAGALIIAPMAASAVPGYPTNSDHKVYLLDGSTGNQLTAGTSLGWTKAVLATPVEGDPDAGYTRPSASVQAYVFIAPRGQERTFSKWNAYTNIGNLDLVVQAQLNPGSLATAGTGTPSGTASVATAGGDYSLGLAFLDSSNTVLEADFTWIEVTAGATAAAATYTFGYPPADLAVSDQFDVDITTEVISAADGTFGLVAPAATSVVLSTPVLSEGAYGLSTSTGQLGEFSVVDQRALTASGWYVLADVEDFTDSTSSNTVGAQHLGVKPSIVGTAPTGVTVADEQVAGSAPTSAWVFASQSVGNYGTANFDAGLTFVAPAGTPAGTYTSTLTITLVDGEP